MIVVSNTQILNTELVSYNCAGKIDCAFHKCPQTHNAYTSRGNDRNRAISRTTLHIPFNFIRDLGEMWRKYIDARIRGSFINIVAVISLSRLARLRPLIFKCQPGSAGWHVLAPRNIICHPPCRRTPFAAVSIVYSREEDTRLGRLGKGRFFHRESPYSGAA